MKKNEHLKFNKFISLNVLKGSFIKNVMTVATGTIFAQVITIIFSPFITRLYGPEAFGVLGVFMAVTALFSSIVSLTYPMAIILPKDDREAIILVKISLYIGAVLSIISWLFLWLFGKGIMAVLNMDILLPYLIFIPIFLFLSAILQVSQQWVIRKKLFNLYSKSAVYQSFLINASKTGFGMLSPSSFLLILLTTIGQLMSILLILFGLKKTIYKRTLYKTPMNSFKKNLILYKDFPKFRAPEVFINGVTQNLPLLLLTSAFGPVSAGFYLLGQRMLALPSQLLGKAVGDVFYPRIAEAVNNKENITNIILRATIALAVVGVFPFGMVICFGPLIFEIAFGEEWQKAGEYARWLSLWSFFVFINNPSVRALPVIFEQKFLLIFTNISLIIRLGLMMIGIYYFNNDIISIILYSVSGMLLNIYLIATILKKSKKYDIRRNAG